MLSDEAKAGGAGDIYMLDPKKYIYRLFEGLKRHLINARNHNKNMRPFPISITRRGSKMTTTDFMRFRIDNHNATAFKRSQHRTLRTYKHATVGEMYSVIDMVWCFEQSTDAKGAEKTWNKISKSLSQTTRRTIYETQSTQFCTMANFLKHILPRMKQATHFCGADMKPDAPNHQLRIPLASKENVASKKLEKRRSSPKPASVSRPGQQEFRESVKERVRRHNGEVQCEATGTKRDLDAAHIVPYSHAGTYSHGSGATNGLILHRAIHTVWDLGYVRLSYRAPFQWTDIDEVAIEQYYGGLARWIISELKGKALHPSVTSNMTSAEKSEFIRNLKIRHAHLYTKST